MAVTVFETKEGYLKALGRCKSIDDIFDSFTASASINSRKIFRGIIRGGNCKLTVWESVGPLGQRFGTTFNVDEKWFGPGVIVAEHYATVDLLDAPFGYEAGSNALLTSEIYRTKEGYAFFRFSSDRDDFLNMVMQMLKTGDFNFYEKKSEEKPGGVVYAHSEKPATLLQRYSMN